MNEPIVSHEINAWGPIESFLMISKSDVLLLINDGINEARSAGTLHYSLINFLDDDVMVYSINEVPIAFCIYHENHLDEMRIAFGYCRPEHRGKGYYEACVDRLKQDSKKSGYTHIFTEIHPSNFVMLDHMDNHRPDAEMVGIVFKFPV